PARSSTTRLRAGRPGHPTCRTCRRGWPPPRPRGGPARSSTPRRPRRCFADPGRLGGGHGPQARTALAGRALIAPLSSRTRPGVTTNEKTDVVEDFGDLAGHAVDIGENHIVGPARRWA